MPLTLVVGPANSAKAGHVLGAYAAATPRGALLVVPNAQDARHYARELAGQRSVLGSVLTFSGLCFEIARRAGYSARRLSALQRERVLVRSVERARLQLLAEAASHPGFVAAAGDLISELERSLVTPQRFASAMQAWAGGDERRAGYARDVAGVHLSYAQELDRLGWVDGDLYAWRALDALRAQPGRWGAAPVFFYGFDDLHGLQRDAVETLSSMAGVEVTVSLTYEAGRTALAARAEVVEELRPLADRVIELPALDEHYASPSRKALHHLERSLFEPASGGNGTTPERREARIDPSGVVRLLEAGGERAEAELLAAEAGELLRNGIAGEEIAIVHRSPRSVAPLFERVFAQYGVALATGYELPFAHTTLGRSILALARCALLPEGRARAGDLLAYLRAPGVCDPELADSLELAVRREGLRTADQARARLRLRLAEIDALRDAVDQAAELARQGSRLLAAHGRRLAPVLDGEGELDARALAAMLRALDEFGELGERPIGQGLMDVLERLEVRAGTRAPGAVVLTAPLEIRARRFHTVILAGLQEGEFPRGSVPEPFLSQELRRELAASSGLRLALREDGLERERYLFYSAVSRATHQLILSYRSSDEEGNLALASPFVADVAELLEPGWMEQRRRRLLADVVWPAEQAPTERERARSRTDASAVSPLERGPESRDLSEIALRKVRHREIVSGGALECYGDCPVKWLVERELRPEQLEPEPEPLARGSYVHEALEEIMRRLGGPVTEASLADALSILGQVVSELHAPIAPGSGEGVRRALLGGIEADLRRYLHHEAADGCDWDPAELELRFGFDEEAESLPPLDLGEGVRVRGAIDRVDVDRERRRAIVRDYKTGATRPAFQGARWSADRRVQVALYMLAVRELMGLEPVAGLYQPLRGADLRPRGVFLEGTSIGSCLVGNDARDEDGLRAELADASGRAVELATRLRRGDLAPTPSTCSRDGCAYPGICRSG
jgi:ATP-dependent helicase/DNAse subunit B